jgi:hypothetical protein
MKPFKWGNATEESNRLLRVFLCHSSDDKKIVRQYSARLNSDGFIPWLDEERILPGEDWDSVVRRAVRESHVVVVFLSASSITKEGYVQKEIRLVLDLAAEKPEDTIFVIPARVQPCEVPERLRGLQQVDLFDGRGYERLTAALRRREKQVRDHTSPDSGAPPEGGNVRAPDDPPLGLSETVRRNTRSRPRGDTIALMIFAATALGLPGIYMAVPGVGEYVRNKLAAPRFDDASKQGSSLLVKTASETDGPREPTSSADRPAQIYVQTSVLPARLYLDGAEVATLNTAAPSTTLDTSPGSHKVMVRSENFEQETVVRLMPNSPAQAVFFDRDQNKVNK